MRTGAQVHPLPRGDTSDLAITVRHGGPAVAAARVPVEHVHRDRP
jgi:hypothetical protein